MVQMYSLVGLNTYQLNNQNCVDGKFKSFKSLNQNYFQLWNKYYELLWISHFRFSSRNFSSVLWELDNLHIGLKIKTFCIVVDMLMILIVVLLYWDTVRKCLKSWITFITSWNYKLVKTKLCKLSAPFNNWKGEAVEFDMFSKPAPHDTAMNSDLFYPTEHSAWCIWIVVKWDVPTSSVTTKTTTRDQHYNAYCQKTMATLGT